MAGEIKTASGKIVKMNTRAGAVLPDVDIYQDRLWTDAQILIEKLDRHEISPDDYIDGVRALHQSMDLAAELKPWIERALDERKDQVLNQKTTPTKSWTMQLLYLEAGEVHPPHCHHNLISTQVVLHGRVYAREWDRVARLGPDTILLRTRTDRWFGPGDRFETTEVSRNAHWFCADDKPAVMLNFYILGFQEWTFDPPGTKGRRMLAPTVGAQSDGLIVARELSLADGYGLFGDKQIADIPLPRATNA
jgi:quercetin dioxygenase-like cupin family protein